MLAAQPASALGLGLGLGGRFAALEVEEPAPLRVAFRLPPARSLAPSAPPPDSPEARRAAFEARVAECLAEHGALGYTHAAPDARNYMLKIPTADGHAWVTGNCVVWRRDILYTYGGGITLTHTITDPAELRRYDPWAQPPCHDHEARLHALHHTTKPRRHGRRPPRAPPLAPGEGARR